jgi:hypothetical protein
MEAIKLVGTGYPQTLWTELGSYYWDFIILCESENVNF